MYFPVAGIEVHPLIPPLIALLVSFGTSMGGVSGAFVLLPVQMSVLGFTSPAVSATNHLYNVVAIPGGVYRYLKERRMVWPLTGIVVVGTLPGVLLGTLLRLRFLPDPREFKAFVALVLSYIAARMLQDLLKRQAPSPSSSMKGVKILHVSWRRLAYEFEGQVVQASSVAIMSLSLLVGLIGGTYGIGGGAILSPIFVSVFQLPIHTVAGAALMGTFVTSLAGVLFFQVMAPFFPGVAVAPDWQLGVLFGLGGLAGTYLGARCQRFVPVKVIKGILISCVAFVIIKYLVDFVR